MDYLRASDLRLALLCSRQVGKSATTGIKASWIVRHGGLALVVAPTERQSALLFRQVRDHLNADGAELVRETQTELELSNGGRAICLPGNRPSGIRGHTLRHDGPAALIVDEAAFGKTELWPVLSPMLAAAPDAAMYLLSTPCGPVGEFHRIWTEGGEAWRRVSVTAEECPRISEEFLEQEKARLGALYAQEYECQFVAAAGAFFSTDLVDAMFGGDSAEDLVGEMFKDEEAA